MSQSSTTVRCPSCEAPVRARLSAEVDVEAADGLFGREVRCDRCDSAFEVLFYPP
ncbi:MAG: hypothetical protein ABEJ28_01100 [Salinigranum sp.]